MKRTAKIEIYKDLGNEYRWRLLAPNGRIMADSSESYQRKFAAFKAAMRASAYMLNVEFVYERAA